jgi:hypothetical protein
VKTPAAAAAVVAAVAVVLSPDAASGATSPASLSGTPAEGSLALAADAGQATVRVATPAGDAAITASPAGASVRASLLDASAGTTAEIDSPELVVGTIAGGSSVGVRVGKPDAASGRPAPGNVDRTARQKQRHPRRSMRASPTFGDSRLAAPLAGHPASADLTPLDAPQSHRIDASRLGLEVHVDRAPKEFFSALEAVSVVGSSPAALVSILVLVSSAVLGIPSVLHAVAKPPRLSSRPARPG